MSIEETITVEQPVTVMVVRTVRAGAEAEFERAMAALTASALSYPGHLGVNVFRPATAGDRRYRIVFKFDSGGHLDAWRASAETRRLLECVQSVTEGEPEVTELTGLEAWFTLPGRLPATPPPRRRMALVTWLALWPLVSLLLGLLGPWMEPLPFLVRTGILTGLVTVLMTWVVMPRLTALLSGWLFRPPAQ
ncbi:MAG TPA: antibiotic biosynthesis monooxygenase [Azospirillum sp.]|nr:antibiotic biosynthesis monooxygenase [Azospirillum sp.]